LAAVQARAWEEAREQLETLRRLNSSYRDATALLCQAYYQSAVTAINMRQWDKAIEQIETLQRLDSNYRDATALLCQAYYQSAVTAINMRQWDKAIEQIETLQRLNSSYYRDAMALLCEPYYQSAVAAINAKEWGKAIEQIEILRKLNSSYKNVGVLWTRVQNILKEMVIRYYNNSSATWPPLRWMIDNIKNMTVEVPDQDRIDLYVEYSLKLRSRDDPKSFGSSEERGIFRVRKVKGEFKVVKIEYITR